MKCSHIKSDGTQCKANTVFNSNYCWYHNPDIPDEVRLSACSKGGKANTVNNFIESPLPEIKIEKMQDLALMLSDTINNMRIGKISQKSGSSFGYLSFILFLVLEKALKEKEKERIDKLKAEGQYRPEPKYGTKFYVYKDEYFLDKDGRPLVVERKSSDFYPPREFIYEDREQEIPKTNKRGNKRKKKKILKYPLKQEEHEKLMNDPDYHNFQPPDENSDVQKNESSDDYVQKTVNVINALKSEFEREKNSENPPFAAYPLGQGE